MNYGKLLQREVLGEKNSLGKTKFAANGPNANKTKEGAIQDVYCSV